MRQCLAVLLPPACLVCDRPLKTGYLCFRCMPSTPSLSEALHARCARCFGPHESNSSIGKGICATCLTLPLATDSQRFIWEYRGLTRDFIKAMKYRPSKKLARLAGDLLAKALPLLLAEREWDLVVPIPSSAKTFRKRCFHPCVEMGYHIARTLDIPLAQALMCNPKRDPQAKLHHDARLRGLKRIFTIRAASRVRNKRVLLIEDVITTGATVSAAAQCLKGAGATRVDVLALARTQVWQRFRHRVWLASEAGSEITSRRTDF